MISAAEQQIIDGLLDLEDVDVDPQIRITPPHPLDRARHHDLRNARHRADAQLGQIAASDLGDDIGEIVHLLLDAVDLLEDVTGFRGAALPGPTARISERRHSMKCSMCSDSGAPRFTAM